MAAPASSATSRGRTAPSATGCSSRAARLAFPTGLCSSGAPRPMTAASTRSPCSWCRRAARRAPWSCGPGDHPGPKDRCPPPGSGTGPPPATAAPSTPQVLGWVVAGVVVGILLTGALGAVVIYHLVLRRSDLAGGSTGKLDPKGKKPPRSARDDTEPIYEVMESPLELPQPEGRNPETDPQPPPAVPLPPQPDPNYTELLQRAESVYAQIQR
ncbi:uncharacterized protein LOC101938093 [Chrysemys picta bellii]|uniref:uncharacterized protein LOC101938093 n=1 Tax=Chrysemys picta bellii TaxID=8478 RepID=UPI0032B177F9